MKTKSIDLQTYISFAKLFHLLKQHGFVHPPYLSSQLLPNRTIGTIDFLLDPPELRVGDSYLVGYCFGTNTVPRKSLLTVEKILEHFDELIIKRNHVLLEKLYIEAYLEQ